MNIELNRTYFRLHYFRSPFDQNPLRAYFSLHSCDSRWRNKVHFYWHTLLSSLVFCACYTAQHGVRIGIKTTEDNLTKQESTGSQEWPQQ